MHDSLAIVLYQEEANQFHSILLSHPEGQGPTAMLVVSGSWSCSFTYDLRHERANVRSREQRVLFMVENGGRVSVVRRRCTDRT